MNDHARTLRPAGLSLLLALLAGCTSTTAPQIEAPALTQATTARQADAPELSQIRAELTMGMVTFQAHVDQSFADLNSQPGWTLFTQFKTSTGRNYAIGWQDKGSWAATKASPAVLFGLDGSTVYGPVSFVARGRTLTFAAPLSLIEGTPTIWYSSTMRIDDDGGNGGSNSYAGAFVPAREHVRGAELAAR